MFRWRWPPGWSLDAANAELATTKAGRDNLEGLAGEQGELVQAGQERERNAAQAQTNARTRAIREYAAANRLLRERTGGDQCAAVTRLLIRSWGCEGAADGGGDAGGMR